MAEDTPDSVNGDFIWKKESFGPWLRWLRTDRGLSLRTLEMFSGVDDAEIHRIETGQQECRIETLLRLCGPLGVAPGWILDRVESSSIAAFYQCVLADTAFDDLVDRLNAKAEELRKSLAQNLASACTLAAILIRSSLPESRAKIVSFPHPDWEVAFFAFAKRLSTLEASVDRASILHSLWNSPARALANNNLLPEAPLKEQIEDFGRPKARRKSQSHAWAPYVVQYPSQAKL
jgi:transcriptional regulator with XRE-family HTH domain